jgi:hypothetical protein
MAGTGRQLKATFIDADQVKKVATMLLALEDEQRLNEWETNFISDISSKFDNNVKLNTNQYVKIETIYRKFN